MRRWPLRILAAAIFVLLTAFAATLLVSADRFRVPIEQGLQRALGREVEIQGASRFTLLPRPGFAVNQVVIHEDPALSVEPFAYVATVELGISPWTLLSGRVEASTIRLIEPSINLMKVPDGGWNVQGFVNKLLEPHHGLPGLEVSGGRFNFKLGDLKSVFYLAATDLVVEADSANPNRFGIRFSGEPARTDRALRAFGQLSGRGMLEWGAAGEPRIQLTLNLARSAIAEFATLLEGHSAGLGGFVSSRARLAGPLSNIAIDGSLQLDEFERWSWLLPTSSEWGLDFRGKLDLREQMFTLETTPGKTLLPVAFKVRVTDILARPRWAALWTLRDLPVNSLRSLIAEMTPAIPANLPLAGKVTGVLSVSRSGVHGRVVLNDASIGEVTAEQAGVIVEGSTLTLLPTPVVWNQRKAKLAARFDAATSARDLEYQTAEMPIADLSKLPFIPPVPYLGQFQGGQFAGTVRYQADAAGVATWTVETGVTETTLRLDGLALPVRIQSAALAWRSPSLSLTAIRGEVGGIEFEGDYRNERLNLHIETLSVGELGTVLEPAFHRPGSLLSRTLRRREPLPEWLRLRKLSGELIIGDLSLGARKIDNLRTPFRWTGPSLEAGPLAGTFQGGTLSGQVNIELAGAQPLFRGQLGLNGVQWRNIELDIEGDVHAEGEGAALWASLAADGSFAARQPSALTDQDWRTASGCFLYRPDRLELNGVQASIGGVTYTGQGASTFDGRLALDLTAPRSSLKLSNLLIPFE
jgi:AsmA protein